ncbi:MAG: hypothetical protein E7168_02185 [Firmicutes bacterium]|nr:hypothetical protein [Bacillota bacterium]
MLKKSKPYIITSSLVIGIFFLIFISKGIYPFGENSLIWGDMHDQITAFYYHFYDCFKGSQSLFINFSTSGGINFLGILAYYILSPISFLVLLFPRDEIYLAVSIIVAFKILLSSLTCLYYIRFYFKKLPSMLSVLLAIIYAFSGYSLIMYQITPWIDVMYTFPILMIGLKKLLDLEKPVLYIVCLTYCLISSFYVSIMVVFFIFLSSFIYLLVYKDKEERKKAILSLGIFTVISLLLSLFIVLPSYLQISISSRVGFDISNILNSKTGPITDKLSMLMFGGVMWAGILLLVQKFKEHKEFLTWYFPTCLFMLIPVIIEPILKAFHFGSYAFFPYRHGFILIFLLIIGACYGWQVYEGNSNKISLFKKCLVSFITFIGSFVIIYNTISRYQDFQNALKTLTISIDHSLLFYLIFITFISIFCIYLIILLTRKKDNFVLFHIFVISLVHIVCCSFLYLGIDSQQDYLMSQYIDLQKLESTYKEGDYYRIKNITSSFIMNSGMVTKYHTLDHFTSLTDRSNLETLKKMGYSSMWVKTFSKGGTLFTDTLLANKYIMSKTSLNNEYYEFIDKIGSIFLYKTKVTPSYGYVIKNNDSIFDKDNSFEVQNSIYQSITGSNNKLFEISSNFDLHNIKHSIKDGINSYDIIDEDAFNYLEKNISVNGKKKLYLEILKDLNNSKNSSIYQKFNIYINGELFLQNALTEYNNGTIDLGTYEDTTVNVEIELRSDLELDNITIGIMDLELYDEFLESSKIDTKINYIKNKIQVEVSSDQEQLLFLPISYNDGYKVKVNGQNSEVIRIFDNYLGVIVPKGDSIVEFNFIPKGFIIGTIISVVTLIFTACLLKTSLYDKILNTNFLQTIAHYIYLVLYLGIILVIYIGLTVCYILSYFYTF